MLRQVLRLAPETLVEFVKYRALQPLRARPFPPRALLYIATHRCNARCVMCGLWQGDERERVELSLDALARLLEADLFGGLRYLGVNGGEPFLRADLAKAVALFRDRCPELRKVSITTNGLLPERIAAALEPLTEETSARGIPLNVVVSCHAASERLDEIAGVPGAFARVQQTIECLTAARRAGRLTLSLNCVLLRANLQEADRLLAWAGDREIPVSFVVGELRSRFANLAMAGAMLPPERAEELAAFFEARASDGRSGFATMRYRELARLTRDPAGRRSQVCHYAMGGLVLGPDGALFYCPHSQRIGSALERPAEQVFFDPAQLEYRRRELLQRECLRCPPYTLSRWEIQASLDRVLPALGRELLARLRSRRRGATV